MASFKNNPNTIILSSKARIHMQIFLNPSQALFQKSEQAFPLGKDSKYFSVMLFPKGLIQNLLQGLSNSLFSIKTMISHASTLSYTSCLDIQHPPLRCSSSSPSSINCPLGFRRCKLMET